MVYEQYLANGGPGQLLTYSSSSFLWQLSAMMTWTFSSFGDDLQDLFLQPPSPNRECISPHHIHCKKEKCYECFNVNSMFSLSEYYLKPYRT